MTRTLLKPAPQPNDATRARFWRPGWCHGDTTRALLSVESLSPDQSVPVGTHPDPVRRASPGRLQRESRNAARRQNQARARGLAPGTEPPRAGPGTQPPRTVHAALLTQVLPGFGRVPRPIRQAAPRARRAARVPDTVRGF